MLPAKGPIPEFFSCFVKNKYFRGVGGVKDILALTRDFPPCFPIDLDSLRENRRCDILAMQTTHCYCHFHVPCKIIAVPMNQSGGVTSCGGFKHPQYFSGLNAIKDDFSFMLYVHWGSAGGSVNWSHLGHPLKKPSPLNLNTGKALMEGFMLAVEYPRLEVTWLLPPSTQKLELISCLSSTPLPSHKKGKKCSPAILGHFGSK